MPWMVAATVRSLAHLRSLKEYETVEAPAPASEGATESVAEGPTTRMTGVLEQRVSGLTIHALIAGAVLFCRGLLRRIPVSVLTGMVMWCV
jgi:hypothetical protein